MLNTTYSPLARVLKMSLLYCRGILDFEYRKLWEGGLWERRLGRDVGIPWDRSVSVWCRECLSREFSRTD